MVYLPFFFQKKWQKLAWEVFRGAEMALIENNCIIPLVYEVNSKTELFDRISELKELRSVHLGVVISDSDFISNINLDNFILLAPTQGRDFSSNPNIFQFFLCFWEVEILGKILDELQIPSDQRLILTDFPLGSDALKPFQGIAPKRLKLDDLKELNKTSQYDLYQCYILIGFYRKGFCKWNVIERIRELLGNSFDKKTIITTSTFEDWKILPPRRKSIAEGVVYIYPKLSKGADEFGERFEQKFGYRPGIYSLLVYDSVNVAIKSLEKGPDYNAIKSCLTTYDFDSVVWGKIGLSSQGLPYIIGKVPSQVFTLKFVDEKGEFKRR